MRIIGFCGPAGAGKDTVAQLVADATSGTVVRQGFADALKVSAARALGFEGVPIDCVDFCNDLKTTGTVVVHRGRGSGPLRLTGRKYLQRYGTEAHRDVFGQDFWLDAVLPEGRDDCDLLLIPDVRFVNEAERVRERGGEVWSVERPDVAPVEAHSSEAGIPHGLLSRVIINNGSLDDLRFMVAAELVSV